MTLPHRCIRSTKQRGVATALNLLLCSCFIFSFGTLVRCQDTNFTFSQFDADSLTLVSGSRIVDGKILLVNMSVNSNQSTTVGRALYPTQVQLRNSDSHASFRTSFTFSTDTEPGNSSTSQSSGIAWGFFPDNRMIGDAGRFLGLLNGFVTENVPLFAIKVDTSCHLGVDLGTMNSMPVVDMAEPLGNETSLCVRNRGVYTLNVRYNALSHGLVVELLDIGGVTVGKINETIDLYPYVDDLMYVGFSSSAMDEQPVEVRVLSWDFISTLTSQLPSPLVRTEIQSRSAVSSSSFTSGNRVVYGAAAGICAFLLLPLLALGSGFWCLRRRSKAVSSDAMVECGVAQVGPRRFTFKELCFATKNFNQSEILSQGRSGSVYRGVLSESGVVVAVKLIQVDRSRELDEKEFQVEVSILSQIRHPNLVQLKGWCSEKSMLCLVYKYLPNKTLDSLLRNDRGKTGATLLPWSTRLNILTGVASALAYLHDEIGQCILHGELNPGNVLLDVNLNARLADFGMAKLIDHDQAASTTLLGYMAPELPQTRKPTTRTDVWRFGILVLKVLCGRDVDAATKVPLVDSVWSAHAGGDVLTVADAKIRDDADANARRAMERTLQLGLLCAHPDPACRPNMRDARQMLLGDYPLPQVPAAKPVVRYAAVLSLYQHLQLPHDDGDEVVTSSGCMCIAEDSFSSQSKPFFRRQ